LICEDGDNETRQCGVSNAGACSYGERTRSCNSGYWSSWSACTGAIYPVSEVCDDLVDNNCNGIADEFCNCTSQSYYRCYNNDVYWYDSCGRKEIKKEECYANGCVNNECVVCESHNSYRCYGGDVYWYNSCNLREEKKEECRGYSCLNNECNVPACEDNEEICNGVDDNCNGEIDEGGVCEPLSLEIISPVDFDIFYSKNIMFNIEMNKRSEKADVYDNGKRVGYCINCDSFEKTFSFSPGEHLVRIEAYESLGNIVEDSVSFSVYISDLRMSSIFPRSSRKPVGEGSEFSISYRSSLPVTGKLNINCGNYESELSEECPAGTRESCLFYPVFPENFECSANVIFELEDAAGDSAVKETELLIDTKKPELSIESEVYNRLRYKQIKVFGTLSEKASVEYLDFYGQWKRVCSSCSSFRKYFRVDSGENLDLQFRGTDLAGNQEEFSFFNVG